MNEKFFKTLLGVAILGLIIGTVGLINFLIFGPPWPWVPTFPGGSGWYSTPFSWD